MRETVQLLIDITTILYLIDSEPKQTKQNNVAVKSDTHRAPMWIRSNIFLFVAPNLETHTHK